jgi:hypothetical protein
MERGSGIISDPSLMLQTLMSSKEQGTVIGIWATVLGDGLHMCGIENVADEKSGKLIELNETDLNGVPLKVKQLHLVDISTVFPFRFLFR